MVFAMQGNSRSATVRRNGPVQSHRTALLGYRSMSKDESNVNQHTVSDRPWTDESTLRGLYWDENLSLAEIGNNLGCSLTTIHNWMDRHGIDRRPQGTRIQGPMELRDADLLRELYVGERLTMAEIGDRLGCHETSVLMWLNRHGIDTRERRIATPSGEDHYRWAGGVEPYYGPDYYRARPKALERDDYRCRRCGMTLEEHRETYGRSIAVHHIDGDRQNNALENLITFCYSCHNKLEGLPIDTR